MVRIESHLWP